MQRIAVGLATLALFLIGVRPAWSGEFTVFDQTAFNNDTSGRTTIDFAGLAPDGSFKNFPVPPGFTSAGVNFSTNITASNGFLFVGGKGFYDPNKSVLSAQQSTTGNNNVVISLPGAFTAIGFNKGSDSLAGTPITLTFSSGDTVTVATPGLDQRNFAGFLFSTPITGLRIDQSGDDFINLSDFTFGNALPGAVPEPASLTLAAVGALGLGGWALRRGRRATDRSH